MRFPWENIENAMISSIANVSKTPGLRQRCNTFEAYEETPPTACPVDCLGQSAFTTLHCAWCAPMPPTTLPPLPDNQPNPVGPWGGQKGHGDGLYKWHAWHEEDCHRDVWWRRLALPPQCQQRKSMPPIPLWGSVSDNIGSQPWSPKH